MAKCACGSRYEFGNCCGRYIGGQQAAPDAEALMRSRYTAYVTGNIDYLERTSGGDARLNFDGRSIAQSMAGAKWLGLKIHSHEASLRDPDEAIVRFTVRFRQEGTLWHQDEVSYFKRIAGHWFYCRGETDLRSSSHKNSPRSGATGRNDPCACGSGRKYKKCCGSAQ